MKTKITVITIAIITMVSTTSFSQSKWDINAAYNFYKDPQSAYSAFYRNNFVLGISLNPSYKLSKRLSLLSGIDFYFKYKNFTSIIDNRQYIPFTIMPQRFYTYYTSIPLKIKYEFMQCDHWILYAKAGVMYQNQYRRSTIEEYENSGPQILWSKFYENSLYAGYGLGIRYNIKDKWGIFLEANHTIYLCKFNYYYHGDIDIYTNHHNYLDTKLGVTYSF